MTSLAPPWEAYSEDTEGGATVMIYPETICESSEIPVSNVLSFGVFAIEVRPICLATCSVEGGEKNNPSSAQGFYRKGFV